MAIDILKSEKLNNRLICHENFRRLLVDPEVFVDRIAEMHTEEFTSIMHVGRLNVLKKNGDIFKRMDFGECRRDRQALHRGVRYKIYSLSLMTSEKNI